MNFFTLISLFILGLWVIWGLVAIVKKAYAVASFLLVTAGIWSLLAFVVFEGEMVAPMWVVGLIVLSSAVRIIREYERGVLFRLGRQKELLGPGLNFVIPFGVDQVRRMDLRTMTIDVPKQEVITRDNVPALVDAVVYFNILDPVLAVVKVMDYVRSTSLLGQTILRSVLGEHELDELLSKRTELNNVLRTLLDEATDPWGIKVTAVEVKAIELPETMKRAMARQAEAERERRSKVIAAEGEFQASKQLAAAAGVIGTEPAALQLRYLQTLSEISIEKNSTIIFPLPLELLRYFDAITPKT